MKIIVTGGSGFIGSALIRFLINETTHEVLNLDSLTYAGNPISLLSIDQSERYQFVRGDIRDEQQLDRIFKNYSPDLVMHLAAESHVDRSLDKPGEFISTNVLGTFALLQASLRYYQKNERSAFRFHHVSTDEVYGSLGAEGLFTENSPYQPSSPYSASKAASDHFVRAWHTTYGLPVVVTNCSNNYGPYQFPEKLIPLMVLNALQGKPMPVYGNGQQVRDWLYVDDHARALYLAATEGTIGATYNIGGHNERANLDVVETICHLMNERLPEREFSSLITHVTDRPGHDTRYAIDASWIEEDLGWKPIETFESGLAKTIDWYLDNPHWCQIVQKPASSRETIHSAETFEKKITLPTGEMSYV